MRRLVVLTLVGSLALSALPSAALAGGPHAVQNRWIGVGIGAAVVTLGGILLSGVQAPVVAAPPPVAYVPPPVVYVAPAPPVVYVAPPAVVYAPHRVVVRDRWMPPGQWRHLHR